MGGHNTATWTCDGFAGRTDGLGVDGGLRRLFRARRKLQVGSGNLVRKQSCKLHLRRSFALQVVGSLPNFGTLMQLLLGLFIPSLAAVVCEAIVLA